ncbi:MAG TPA: endonuclease Q family protein [Candidatus Omnitrophota bacterium]|nr:endonuclease Q family protein [Candidatus Omnitrophota bacterium]
MQFIADFHIHSKYSRATSKDMDVKNIAKWAKLKGIQLMGTGDFTHHLWLEELKSALEPQNNGLFMYNGINFMLTSEISSIYSKKGKTYRVHIMIFAPSFKVVDKINQTLSAIGNLASDGRPILGLDVKELTRIVMDISADCFIVPAHVWTPWFSVFGSASGFNKIEYCFEEQTKNIHCLETGLSSDPAMNWRWSALDKFSLISNSDSHSPSKIGREANVFDCKIDYYDITGALKTKDKKKFLYTIEFFPEEGKYHFDGHRNCDIRLSPKESKQNNNICPKCKRPLTIGVMNRVEQLSDREEGFVPKDAIPFKNLIPLDEIIADAKGVGKSSQAVEKEYHAILSRFGTEFNILLDVDDEQLKKSISPRIAEGIIRVRKGNVKIYPGYDGEYGKIQIFDEGEDFKQEEQLRLF